MTSFDIDVRTQASLHPEGAPGEFVSHYTAAITATDDAGAPTVVGKVVALRVHAGLAHNAGASLFEACDAHTHELHYLHMLLYDPSGHHFWSSVVRRFGAVEPDLLVLDYVVLAPAWRKLGLGLRAVRRLVDVIGGGCGLAVGLIAPLRDDAHQRLGVPRAWLPRHTGAEEKRAATTKLRRYFRRMGFVRLGRTPHYALPLNQVTPTAGELLGERP